MNASDGLKSSPGAATAARPMGQAPERLARDYETIAALGRLNKWSKWEKGICVERER